MREKYQANPEPAKQRARAQYAANPNARPWRFAEWKLKNPEKYKLVLRKHRLKKYYGLTAAEVEDLYQRQEGRCCICREARVLRTKAGLYVDHDHATGKVRGLLCANCNAGLGHFRDNPTLLRNAALYLEAAA